MGLFVRIVPTTGAIAATADAATYAACGDTEIALFVGKTGPTPRQRGIIIQSALRHLAQKLARKIPNVAEPGTRASGSITVGAETNTDTVTIDGTALTVVAANPTSAQILHGATPADTAINLRERINGHATISAKVHAAIDGTTAEKVNLTAHVVGTAGNAYTLAEGGTTFTISGGTLAGGTIKRKTAILVPGNSGFTLADKNTGDAVTEADIGLVWGQTAHASFAKSRLFITSVEKLLSYFKSHYGRVA